MKELKKMIIDNLCSEYPIDQVEKGIIMKVTVNQDNTIQLEEVFNSIVLKTKDGEEMAICMRDSGFEFKYQGEWYFAKEGYVEPFQKSVRGNYLVEQKHDGSMDRTNDK